MPALAYYNGKIGDREEIAIPLSDRSIFFGDAIYDAALAVNGNIVWEIEHIKRFFGNASALSIPLPYSEEQISALLRKIVKKSNYNCAFLYFQVSRNLDKRMHSARNCQKSNLLITVEKFTLQDSEKALSLITYPDKRYGYCNIKTVNLLPSVLAATFADNEGCDEAVFIRDGIVTECSRSNIFIIKDEKLLTHPKDERILPGIARQKILLVCQRLGIPAVERVFTEEELFSADEVLISSTTKLCLGANSVNGMAVGGKNPSLRRKIQGELHKEIDEFSKYW